MDHQIRILIASIGFTLWFITFANLPMKLKLWFKPFNCEVCLPVYLTIAMWWMPGIVIDIVSVATWSAIASAYITHKLNED